MAVHAVLSIFTTPSIIYLSPSLLCILPITYVTILYIHPHLFNPLPYLLQVPTRFLRKSWLSTLSLTSIPTYYIYTPSHWHLLPSLIYILPQVLYNYPIYRPISPLGTDAFSPKVMAVHAVRHAMHGFPDQPNEDCYGENITAWGNLRFDQEIAEGCGKIGQDAPLHNPKC